MQEIQKLLLDISLLFKADFPVLTDVEENAFHLSAVVGREILPKLDQGRTELGLNVRASELGLSGRGL